jgi:hypothetical protein
VTPVPTATTDPEPRPGDTLPGLSFINPTADRSLVDHSPITVQSQKGAASFAPASRPAEASLQDNAAPGRGLKPFPE